MRTSFRPSTHVARNLARGTIPGLRRYRLQRSFPLAFTLLEVLVVVGIIVLLAAVLLPSMSHARRQTRTLACAANLRTTGMAVHYYTQDQRDYYPSPGWWAELCYHYIQKLGRGTPTPTTPSASRRVHDQVAFYHCPDDVELHPSTTTRWRVHREIEMSYGLSAFLTNEAGHLDSAQAGIDFNLANEARKATEVKRPAEIVMVTDAGNDGLHQIDELDWDFDDEPDYNPGLLEVHHVTGNNFLYADLHNEFSRIRGKRTATYPFGNDRLEYIASRGIPPFPRRWMPVEGIRTGP